VTAAVVLRVDPVLVAERAELVDGGLAGARQFERTLRAAQLHERSELGPPRDREAAVAAARAAAADVLLEHDDIARRLALLDADGCPEPGVAAAHDGDVGARGAFERRCGRLAGRERLVEPERAMRHGAGSYGDSPLMLAITFAVESVAPFLVALSK